MLKERSGLYNAKHKNRLVPKENRRSVEVNAEDTGRMESGREFQLFTLIQGARVRQVSSQKALPRFMRDCRSLNAHIASVAWLWLQEARKASAGSFTQTNH